MQHPFILPARALITRIKMFQWHSTMSTKWDFWVEEVCNISNCVVIALLLATVYQADIANSRLEGSNIIERRRNEIMTRNHNLDVFYKPMTCDDLVVDVKECEIAIGWYYVA